MMRRLLFPVGVTILLAACASTEEKTLENLGDLDIKIDTEAPILGARNKAMDSYWELMSTTPEQAQKAEAMRRLADLEMERSEERFQKQLEVLDQSQSGGEVDQQALKNITYRGAIKLYEDALKVSIGGPQEVAILYQLSKAYDQAGDPEKALAALNRVLAIRPNAENRDELQFRRGEILFDLRRFKQAEQAYSQTVAIGPVSGYYEKALSKRGWAAFKQGKFEAATGSFFALIDRKLRTPDGSMDTEGEHLSRGDKELVNDLFRVVILSFDELGGAKAVTDYFAAREHRDYELRIYRELGDYYLGKGRVRDAADTYTAFAKVYPMHEQAFEFDLKAMDAYTGAGFASLLMQAKQDFVRRYRINGPYWKRHEEKEYTLLAKLRPALEANSEDVARYYHAQAQKTKSSVDYQTAFIWYKQHLKWFGQSENAQKLNFLYAELLFEAGDYKSAAEEYEKTAYRYVRAGRDAEAGYAALLAYAKQEEKLTGKEQEIWSRLSVGSALRFGKTFPDDPRAANVLTKAAQDMFALKKYTQASVAARHILELSSEMSNDMRRTAWMIIARAEFEKGDYTRAEVAYKVALSLTPEENENYVALKEGLAAAVYKQGEFMRSKGNTQAAIAQFERVGEVAPSSSINVAAEFDVAASMMTAGDWQGAIQRLVDFRLANPDHALAMSATEKLVKAYLETGQQGMAAQELERLAKVKPDPDVQRAALWQAADLYEKAGSGEEEARVYKQFIAKFPSPLEQAMEARQKLASLSAKAGHEEDRRYWLKEIIKRDKAGGAERTDRTRYLAAKAAYELATPALQAFQNVKLVAPLKENLKEKKQRMKVAVDAYTLAVDYGVEEVTTASVFWLGEIYREFGRDLMASERPAGLSAEELEQYDILLEEQAYPFEEKSIHIHESNVERVAQGTYDEWVKKSFEKLKTLNPARYAKAEKGETFAGNVY